jgi:integrase/recombinase XerD
MNKGKPIGDSDYERDLFYNNKKIQSWIDESVNLSLLLETVSVQTQNNYAITIRNFYKWFNESRTDVLGIDAIMLLDTKELTLVIMKWISHLKGINNPNSIPTKIAAVKSLCEMSDVLLNWKKINKMLPRRTKLTGQTKWETDEIREMLDVTNKLVQRALIMVFCSTGCRIGALVEFKVKDISDWAHTKGNAPGTGINIFEKYGCKTVHMYAGDSEEYTTFLTPEATKALDSFFKYRESKGGLIKPESYVFNSRWGKNRPKSRASINMMVQRIVESAGVRGVKTDGRYPTQLCHGFRKRFDTVLKGNINVNDNAVEKMMGHKRGLDGTYLQFTDEELFKHFLNGIPSLTIYDDNYLKAKNMLLENKFNKTFDEMVAEVKAMDDDFKLRQRFNKEQREKKDTKK